MKPMRQLLASLLVLAAALHAAEGKFPYCRCIDYSFTSSPYVLDWVSSKVSPDSFSADFELKAKTVTPTRAGVCYDVIKKNGINKIQFDTSAVCIGKVKVYVDGVLVTANKATPAPNVDGTYIKVVFKTPARPGAKITVVGFGDCANPKTLLNSDDTQAYRYSMFNHYYEGPGAPCCPTSGGDQPPGESPTPGNESPSPPPEKPSPPPKVPSPPPEIPSPPPEIPSPPPEIPSPPPEIPSPPPEIPSPPPEIPSPPPEIPSPPPEIPSPPPEIPSPPPEIPSPPPEIPSPPPEIPSPPPEIPSPPPEVPSPPPEVPSPPPEIPSPPPEVPSPPPEIPSPPPEIPSPPPEIPSPPPEIPSPPPEIPSPPPEIPSPPPEVPSPPPETPSPPPEESSTTPEGSSPPPSEESSAPAEESSTAEESSSNEESSPGEESSIPPGQNNPPGQFPWCQCSSNNFDTPWFVSSVQHEESALTNDYTITFGENGCLGTSPCCNMDFWKIEFNIGDLCRHSIDKAFMTINHGLAGNETVQIKVGYVTYGHNAMVCKFTQLGLNRDTAYGTSIKFSLKKNSACPDINTWLLQDAYAIFNRKQKCCPTWKFDALNNVGGSIYGAPIDDGTGLLARKVRLLR